MPEKIIKQAALLYNQGRIAEAYTLYQQAAALYGKGIVAYNLKQCEQLLNEATIINNNTTNIIIKPRISLLITSHNNLSHWDRAMTPTHQPYEIAFFFNTADGIRPLHDLSLLNVSYNTIEPRHAQLTLPEADYVLTIHPDTQITSIDVINFLESKKQDKSATSPLFSELDYHPLPVFNDRVSIIIPTFKRPLNLAQAIESVIVQDYKDKEIIVVSDNGLSSELAQQTREVIAQISSKHPESNIQLLEHRHNRNGAAARNTGLLQATGEYICFLDDDDIYLTGRLTESIDVLSASKPDCGAVYCGYTGWKSKENDLQRYKPGNLTKDILLFNYHEHYLHTNTITYKRDALLALNGFDETYRRHQDLELNLRFFERYTIDIIKKVLVQLTPKPSNISNKAAQQDLIKLKLKFLNRFRHLIVQYPAEVIADIYFKQLNEISNNYHDGV